MLEVLSLKRQSNDLYSAGSSSNVLHTIYYNLVSAIWHLDNLVWVYLVLLIEWHQDRLVLKWTSVRSNTQVWLLKTKLSLLKFKVTEYSSIKKPCVLGRVRNTKLCIMEIKFTKELWITNSLIISCHSKPWQIFHSRDFIPKVEGSGNKTSLCSKLASTNYNSSLGKPKQMVCLHLLLHQ